MRFVKFAIVLISGGTNVVRESFAKLTSNESPIKVDLSQDTGRSGGVVLQRNTRLSPTANILLLLGKMTP